MVRTLRIVNCAESFQRFEADRDAFFQESGAVANVSLSEDTIDARENESVFRAYR